MAGWFHHDFTGSGEVVHNQYRNSLSGAGNPNTAIYGENVLVFHGNSFFKIQADFGLVTWIHEWPGLLSRSLLSRSSTADRQPFWGPLAPALEHTCVRVRETPMSSPGRFV
jgi:hypothetical protein